MITLTDTQIMEWATQIARKIDHYSSFGESKTFESDYDVGNDDSLTAKVIYECDVEVDEGDYWVAPSWSITGETASVEWVTGTDGYHHPDLAIKLIQMLV